MGRKVFISVLGATFYGESIYTYESEDFRSSLTRYIQCATLEKIHAKEWEPESAGFVLVTTTAKYANWDKSIDKRKNSKGEIVPYIGLEKAIEDMELPFKIEPVDIDDGRTEQEISNNFLKAYEKLKEGDELYIDLTHGFRYLPMLTLVLANYAKFTLHVSCKSFTYGNFELGEMVDGIKVSPIIDLKSLSMIQDWTDAVEHLFFSGNTTKIKELSTEGLRQSRGKDLQYKALKELVSPLDNMTKDMKTCQGKELTEGGHISLLKNQIKKADIANLPPIFRPIFEKISSEFEAFDASAGWKNGIYAAKWCFEHQQFQQAITMMRESVVTGICQHFDLDWRLESDRNCISFLLAQIGKAYSDVKIQFKENDQDIDTSKEVCQKLSDPRYMSAQKWEPLSDLNLLRVEHLTKHKHYLRLVNIYYDARRARNQYNHAGTLNPKKNKSDLYNSDQLIEQIDNRINDIQNWVNETKGIAEIGDKADKVFINLSNHPSETWTISQKTTAEKYGTILDIPFPTIPEQDDKLAIEQMCDNCLDQIKTMSKFRPCIVHIMGEMTFTYAMVNLLKAAGYTCVASTSKRIVEELPDGSKNVKFEFCQFREY